MAQDQGHKKSFGGRAAAAMVAAGILLSRIAGLIRTRVFAHYFGSTDAADAFNAAIRIPNFLQNLLGEGVLSASFIPVYARLRAEGDDKEASELAEAVFAVLFVITSLIVAVGVIATPWLIAAIAPGFHGAKRELTILLVRILFPGAGLFVFSAWCLGILNSHRRFFLSYTAPVLWNLTMIVALLWRGGHVDTFSLAAFIAWASVFGAALQFVIQLPVVFQYLWPLQFRLNVGENLKAVMRNFGPVFVARGVVQISAYIDAFLASFLPMGAVADLAYAQTIYLLPISLFGMSISAAELPAMSSAIGTAEEVARILRDRLARAQEQIAFFVVPSAVGFLLLGDVIVATIFRTGKFGASEVTFVWGILAGSAVGLLASTSGRLFSSTFYALRDTRTPLKFATIRVALTLALGYLFALPLPRLLGIDQKWGVAGLTLSAGIAGWLEFALLRRSLQKRIGAVPYSLKRIFMLWGAAVLAAVLAMIVRKVLPLHNSILIGICVLVPYGTLYLIFTQLMGISTIAGALRALKRR